MPIGTFLDSMPTILFISTHVVFLLIGLWAVKKALDMNLPFAKAFWLYPLVHIGFLSYFGGIFTFKMAVLLEQILIVIMVVWIVSKAQKAS